MKTQLLEDIGQSAERALPLSGMAGQSKAGKPTPVQVPPAPPQSAKPRTAGGVWRQKPAAEPLALPQEQPDETLPLELNQVFEEIAALEAQLVSPVHHAEADPVPAGDRHVAAAPMAASSSIDADPLAKAPRTPEPTGRTVQDPLFDFTVAAPEPSIEPRDVRLTPPVEPRYVLPAAPTPTPAEATPGGNPAHGAAAPQDPLFDFTLPSPTQQPAADPFTPVATGLTRSRKRTLAWAAALVAGALLILGGRWMVQERNDAGSLALLAGAAKEAPPVDQASTPPARVATAPTREAGTDARVLPAEPESRPSPGVPPLVMLEPEPPAAGEREDPGPSASGAAAAVVREPAPVANARPEASPTKPPKPSRTKTQAPAKAGAEPGREGRKREPVRQLARASNAGTSISPGPDTSMAATLKACRAHGYHATQCIKRECRVTQYGFACRGR